MFLYVYAVKCLSLPTNGCLSLFSDATGWCACNTYPKVAVYAYSLIPQVGVCMCAYIMATISAWVLALATDIKIYDIASEL